MKKIFSLIIITAFSFVSFAQSNRVFPLKDAVYTSNSKDTITNTGTADLIIRSQKWAQTVSIEIVVTKISGTVANYCILMGSVDGVNYINVNTDTLTCTNTTTNKKVWVIDGNPYEYYKVHSVGAGTMAASQMGYFMPNYPSTQTNLVSRMKSTTYPTLYLDTVTNSGTNSVTLQVQQSYQSLGIQVVVTKLSGTAAGTVTLQGSNDGSNYVTVSTAYLEAISSAAPFTTSGTATLSVTNVTTNTKIFVVRGSPYQYYRLSHTGSGTMACTLKGYLLGSK